MSYNIVRVEWNGYKNVKKIVKWGVMTYPIAKRIVDHNNRHRANDEINYIRYEVSEEI